MTLRVALVIDGDSAGAKKAADDASRAVSNLRQQTTAGAGPMAAATGATRQLAGENDNLTRSLRGASGALVMMPGPLGQVGSGLGVVALGLGAVTAAAIGTAIAVGSKAVGAFRQLEMEQATYNAVIRATGMAAGRTGEDIEELATSIRQASTATKGEVRSAAAILLTFKSVSGEVFDDVLKLSQDLAAVGFGSITSSATMMGKAFEDPLRGLTALTRVGVTFSQAQQQLIKNFIETGRVGAAQELMVKAIRGQVGGAGAAQGNTLAGATNQLSEATSNLLERWGEQISRGVRLRDVILGISGAIDSMNRNASPEVDLERRIGIARGSAEGLAGRGGWAAAQGRRRAQSQLDSLLAERGSRQQAVDAQMDTPELGRIAAEEERRAGAIKKVTSALEEELATLRKSQVQQEIDKALKDATTTAATAEGLAIEKLVRARFEEKNSLQIAQGRVAALGSAATETEKLSVKQLELNKALKQEVLNEKDYARAIGAAKLESVIGQEERRISLLGDLARVEEEVANTQRKINLERLRGTKISKDEEAAILSRTRILTESQRFENQLAFERAQLSRTTTEQRIAQELRSRGIDPGSREGRDRSRDIRELEQLRISKGLLDDLVGGGMRELFSELRQGVNLWDALGKSGVNALNRVSDKLMDMVMKDLLAKAFGGVNLFSLLGGGGDLGVISGGKSFDVGGYTGDGGRHEVAGVVHRREFVMNADATARHYPVLKAMNDNRMPGYASGGMVGPPPSGFGNSGGAPISIQPQIVSNVHNYSGLPGVTQSVSEKGGVITIDTIIPQLEAALADRQARGRGALSRVAGQSRYRG